MIFMPAGDPRVTARPTAATTSATPKHTRPRGDRSRRGRLGGAPAPGIGVVATAAEDSWTVVVDAGGGSGVVPGSAVSRGFHRASATPTRSTKRVAGRPRFGQPHESPETIASQNGSTATPRSRRPVDGGAPYGPFGSNRKPAR